MKNHILLLFILFSNLTFGQIINGDFELWDTTYFGQYSGKLSSEFAVPDPKTGTVSSWKSEYNFGISQTTESYSGNYALILHNWYVGGNQLITYRDTVSSLPFYLQGNYKYLTGGINGLADAILIVTATKFNGTENDTITADTFHFDSTNVYTPFQLKISHSSIVPDSITIYICNSNKNCKKTDICNLLFIDNLRFTHSPLIVETVDLSDGILAINPNPFCSETTLHSDKILQDATITICNSLGQVLKQMNHISLQTVILHRDNLPNGLYYLYLEDKDKIVGKYKIAITD